MRYAQSAVHLVIQGRDDAVGRARGVGRGIFFLLEMLPHWGATRGRVVGSGGPRFVYGRASSPTGNLLCGGGFAVTGEGSFPWERFFSITSDVPFSQQRFLFPVSGEVFCRARMSSM